IRRGGDIALGHNREVLGYWLYQRFSRLGHREDLREAASVLLEVLHDHGPVNAPLLNNVAVTAFAAGLLSEEKQFRAAVELLRAGEGISDDTDTADQLKRLINLSAVLRGLYRVSKDARDFEQALTAAGTVVSSTAFGNPYHAAALDTYA